MHTLCITCIRTRAGALRPGLALKGWPRPPHHGIRSSTTRTATCTHAAAGSAGSFQPFDSSSVTPQRNQPELPSTSRHDLLRRSYSQDTTNLPPLPSASKGLKLPPTAPITWTFMISYLLFMLVIPIIALLVSDADASSAVCALLRFWLCLSSVSAVV